MKEHDRKEFDRILQREYLKQIETERASEIKCMAEALWLQQGDPYEGYTDAELNDEMEEAI